MFNALVTTMTLIAIGFFVAWWLRADVRDSMEAPKYRFVQSAEEAPRLRSNADVK
jgi:hypothetical protein